VNVDIRSPKYLSAFGPTIDRRSVLPRDVRRLMTKPREAVFAGVALLVGLSRVDAAFFLSGRDLVDGLAGDRLRRMLRTYVQNTFIYHRQYIYDVLVHQYTDWERTVADAESRRDSLVELLADGMYVAAGVELAQRHAALGASATYMYILDYPSRVTGSLCHLSVVVRNDYGIRSLPVCTGYVNKYRQPPYTCIKEFFKTVTHSSATTLSDELFHSRGVLWQR